MLTKEQIEELREDGPQIITDGAWQALIKTALRGIEDRRDAERYNWLKYKVARDFYYEIGVYLDPDIHTDAAIDRAMAEGREGE